MIPAVLCLTEPVSFSFLFKIGRSRLGDYTGGEVWIYDENGTVEMELPCALRGWSHLRHIRKQLL